MVSFCTFCTVSTKAKRRVGADVATRQTVKARARPGANSLDLTIPAAVVKEHNVEPGDVFAVETSQKDGKLVITYSRVFSG